MIYLAIASNLGPLDPSFSVAHGLLQLFLQLSFVSTSAGSLDKVALLPSGFDG